MPKPEEKEKAQTRGQTLTSAEEALEDARDALHGNNQDPEAREAFKAAQRAVVAERSAGRLAREAAGPPPGAINIQRDSSGRVTGWNTAGGDVAIAQGGVDG